MKRTLTQTTLALMMAAATLLPLHAATTPASADRLSREIRKELLTMPFLTIFDNLSYAVEGDTVYLMGQVIRPTLRSTAENRVKMLEGVTKVVNKIEILPLSPYDDRIRLAVARAVYSQSALNRYALGANPSIRIVVKNGNVTLEGVVNNELERTVANLSANGVAGVFSVTNNLQVENSRR
jgi:hyperosmotically inducible periplasmic protein